MERKRWANGKLEARCHFERRKFCNLKCAGLAQEKKPDPSYSTAHYHARKICPPGPCARCGKPRATDVHHRDGDWRNNDRANLERICRKCHLKEHGIYPRPNTPVKVAA